MNARNNPHSPLYHLFVIGALSRRFNVPHTVWVWSSSLCTIWVLSSWLPSSAF